MECDAVHLVPPETGGFGKVGERGVAAVFDDGVSSGVAAVFGRRHSGVVAVEGDLVSGCPFDGLMVAAGIEVAIGGFGSEVVDDGDREVDGLAFTGRFLA